MKGSGEGPMRVPSSLAHQAAEQALGRAGTIALTLGGREVGGPDHCSPDRLPDSNALFVAKY